jgi:hypothetical protein
MGLEAGADGPSLMPFSITFASTFRGVTQTRCADHNVTFGIPPANAHSRDTAQGAYPMKKHSKTWLRPCRARSLGEKRRYLDPSEDTTKALSLMAHPKPTGSLKPGAK